MYTHVQMLAKRFEHVLETFCGMDFRAISSFFRSIPRICCGRSVARVRIVGVSQLTNHNRQSQLANRAKKATGLKCAKMAYIQPGNSSFTSIDTWLSMSVIHSCSSLRNLRTAMQVLACSSPKATFSKKKIHEFLNFLE